MNLNDFHFDGTVTHLSETLKELGVKEDLIQEVAEVCESVRDEVLGK